MSSSCTLQFHFSAHGDSILSRINALREQHRFCDITLLLGGPRGATVQPLHFHGHRAVLAASSDFLRDQFLLHEGQAELSVGVVPSVEIGKRLLLSCYTGLLEVPLRELVSYLTAASALQMSQVVEKCAQAISQYLSPTPAFMNLETQSEVKEMQQPNSFINQWERDAAHPSMSIQEANTEEQGPVVIQSKSTVSQGAEADSQGLNEARDDKKAVINNVELSEGVACCPKLEGGGETQPVHTNQALYKDHQTTSALRCKQCPPVPDHTCCPSRGGSDQSDAQVDSLHNPDNGGGEKYREEEEMFLLAAQLQKCGELTDSSLFEAHLPKSHCSGEVPIEDSDSLLVQRPYLCRRCDRVFQHLEGYVRHLKEHRQHFCLVCGKGFSQRSNLTRHIHVHTGVKPYRCPLCHKTFSQKATLQDHLNLYRGDKPQKCNRCAVHFAYKPGFRRHLKDINGKSSLQNEHGEVVDSRKVAVAAQWLE